MTIFVDYIWPTYLIIDAQICRLWFVFGDDQNPRLYLPSYYILFRADYRFAISQWQKASLYNDVSNWLGCKPSLDPRLAPCHGETALLCNDVSHWLGANLESALHLARVVTDSNRRRFWRLPGKDFRVYSRTNAYLYMRYAICVVWYKAAYDLSMLPNNGLVMNGNCTGHYPMHSALGR